MKAFKMDIHDNIVITLAIVYNINYVQPLLLNFNIIKTIKNALKNQRFYDPDTISINQLNTILSPKIQ